MSAYLVPDEPADTLDLHDAHHWFVVYEELTQTLEGLERTPQVQDRLLLASTRLAWWRRRVGELADHRPRRAGPIA